MKTGTRVTMRWIVFVSVLLGLIIVPFVFWGDKIQVWLEGLQRHAEARPALAAAVIFGLLASDILLPVPSSVVGTYAGILLGFQLGALVSAVGMTVACMIGFWLGRRPARAVAARLVGEPQLKQLDNMQRRYKDWVVVVCRPVPVLAEASVVFAGMSRMSIARFFLMSTLSNIGISMAYARVGEASAKTESFLLAFAAAILVPGLAMLAARRRPNEGD